MSSIVDMDFAENEAVFYNIQEQELRTWRSIYQLQDFANYFLQQWLTGRYWKWQVCHSNGIRHYKQPV